MKATLAVRGALAFGLICSAGAQTGSPGHPQISLAYSVAPSVYQIGQNPNVLFSLTNQNPNAAQQLQPGNTFTFTLGLPGSSISAAGASAVVNSSTFLSSDFQTSLGPNPNQVTPDLSGAAANFPGWRYDLGGSNGFGEPGRIRLGHATGSPHWIRPSRYRTAQCLGRRFSDRSAGTGRPNGTARLTWAFRAARLSRSDRTIGADGTILDRRALSDRAERKASAGPVRAPEGPVGPIGPQGFQGLPGFRVRDIKVRLVEWWQ